MKPLYFVLGAAAFALTGCATPAASDGSAVANKGKFAMVKAIPGSDEEEVCERVDQAGSVIPARVCMTRSEWAAQAEQAREGTDAAQRAALRSCAAGAGCAGG